MKNENTHAYTDMHMHTVYGVTWLHVKTNATEGNHGNIDNVYPFFALTTLCLHPTILNCKHNNI